MSGRQDANGLQQDRRFTDPRIAANQKGRARNKAATNRTIKFGNAGYDAGRACTFTFKGDEIKLFALRPGSDAPGCLGAGFNAFFLDRIPFAAGIATSGPFPVFRTAILADETTLGFGHRWLRA
eukprot:NODE_3438_length_895_cov_1.098958_g3416_i0.p1 GENE.NODE_3438_length_895_cov_1.098958_g3416_i0~~NODE_3438_length_895_cov_1.098958_g3416_i0.p1  ORF type:complete len:124 (-),score=12.43 NODE_3438_length_895_cov_1.098958_g3416_i0:242-613(-)